ncbi:MAG: hypothetical protein R3E01_07035 [Pirellulaceae bacterium]
MSVTTFFEKMIGLQLQRSLQKQNSYRELVAGIATGEEPSPAEVERLLFETKKSITDLQFDVETYQHRMALKAIVASLPKLEQEFEQVQQQIAAADRDLEEAERRHDETTSPLYGRLHEIKEARKDASATHEPDMSQSQAAHSYAAVLLRRIVSRLWRRRFHQSAPADAAARSPLSEADRWDESRATMDRPRAVQGARQAKSSTTHRPAGESVRAEAARWLLRRAEFLLVPRVHVA